MYNRAAAVQYAETWWNGRNPAFPIFDNDCTNFVSQCLLAGGAPMYGFFDRERGWWLKDQQWSFSWAVAHSMRWYLAGSTKGLTAVQVQTAEQLEPGDVICYDFEGNGRYDHTAIVTLKIGDTPFVNAHTYDVQHRLWDYKDSYAYSPHATYLFYKVNDQFSK